MQSGTLQGAYLMLAARSLGLDCGPMLVVHGKINAEFFPDSSWAVRTKRTVITPGAASR